MASETATGASENTGAGERTSPERAGRTASWFFLGVAVFTAVTTLLPSEIPEDVPVLMSVAGACALVGVVARYLPWKKMPRHSPLALAIIAFALIAVSDAVGGVSPYTYATYFIVVFVWAGLSLPPRTSLWLAPLAAAAYIAPPLLGVPHGANAAESAEVAIPACVLVGEVVARISRSDANAKFELAKALEVQRELAWRDPLTGLYNRRAFIELGSAIVAGAAGRGQAPAALFLDLDGLKAINDTWGHETGDALIAQAGGLIASSAPAGSICARLGGDEFCVLAESEDQARLALGQVAQAQAKIPPLPSGAVLSLSIGIGVASLQGQGTAEAVDMPGLTIDDMLNTADRDMLAHKRARGRARGKAGAEQSLDRAPLG